MDESHKAALEDTDTESPSPPSTPRAGVAGQDPANVPPRLRLTFFNSFLCPHLFIVLQASTTATRYEPRASIDVGGTILIVVYTIVLKTSRAFKISAVSECKKSTMAQL